VELSRCRVWKRPGAARGVSILLGVASLAFGNCAAVQASVSAARASGSTAAGPSVAETNTVTENANSYRRLIASRLEWKEPQNRECEIARLQIEGLSADQPLIDPSAFKGNDLALIEVQRRTEENCFSRLVTFSTLVYKAIRLDCLIVPRPAQKQVPPQP
jgi:hypothetical protein